MSLNEKRLALACAVLWGRAMLLMGMANMTWHGYGQDFLRVMASVYPGCHAAGNITQLAIGTAHGTCDGLVGGFVFGSDHYTTD
jgi:hypothetical protein